MNYIAQRRFSGVFGHGPEGFMNSPRSLEIFGDINRLRLHVKMKNVAIYIYINLYTQEIAKHILFTYVEYFSDRTNCSNAILLQIQFIVDRDDYERSK